VPVRGDSPRQPAQVTEQEHVQGPKVEVSPSVLLPAKTEVVFDTAGGGHHAHRAWNEKNVQDHNRQPDQEAQRELREQCNPAGSAAEREEQGRESAPCEPSENAQDEQPEEPRGSRVAGQPLTRARTARTYEVRDQLRGLGLRWDPATHAWHGTIRAGEEVVLERELRVRAQVVHPIEAFATEACPAPPASFKASRTSAVSDRRASATSPGRFPEMCRGPNRLPQGDPGRGR
jgi:hypothetical protein